MGPFVEARPGADAGVCYAPKPNVGVALVDHPDGLHAFLTSTTFGACSTTVLHMPSADGQATPVTLIDDFDDATHMMKHACKSVHFQDCADWCTFCP